MTNLTTPTPSVETVERVALALCNARGENPNGSQVRFVDGQMHSATFLEIARHDARAAISAMSTQQSDELVRLREALRECQDKLWVIHFGLNDDAEREAAINAVNMATRALTGDSNNG